MRSSAYTSTSALSFVVSFSISGTIPTVAKSRSIRSTRPNAILAEERADTTA